MAVIHISETEAAGLAPILARMRAGDSVVIDSGDDCFSVVRLVVPELTRRSFSEMLRRAEERNSHTTLDDQFGTDLEAVIRQHQSEPRFDPWE
jgi:hypothetical protein